MEDSPNNKKNIFVNLFLGLWIEVSIYKKTVLKSSCLHGLQFVALPECREKEGKGAM